MRARMVAVAAGVSIMAVGAAWYRRRRARAQLMSPSGPCCEEAKGSAADVDGQPRAPLEPLEPLSAQLVEHLRARLASPSTSAAVTQGDDPLHLCGVSEAWIAAVHRIVQSGGYATEGSNPRLADPQSSETLD